MLETLYPGRIDLGIGRAPGSDRFTAHLLAHGPGRLGVQHYPEQVADLLGYLGRGHEDARLNGVRAMPQGETQPEVWLLGSSLGSARFAAHFGCPYSFAHFIQPRDAEAALELYRSEYRPSERHPEPRASVGVSAMVADTERGSAAPVAEPVPLVDPADARPTGTFPEPGGSGGVRVHGRRPGRDREDAGPQPGRGAGRGGGAGAGPHRAPRSRRTRRADDLSGLRGAAAVLRTVRRGHGAGRLTARPSSLRIPSAERGARESPRAYSPPEPWPMPTIDRGPGLRVPGEPRR